MNPFFNGNTRPLQVSKHRIELAFKDDTRASLHEVMCDDQVVPDRYLRAMPHACGEFIVDLRKLAPELGEELCTVEPRDLDYHVFMTLRGRFDSLDDFMTVVLRQQLQQHEVPA